MAVKLKFEEVDSCLIAFAAGRHVVQDVLVALERIHSESVERRKYLILVDAREMGEPASNSDRAAVGKFIAEKFAPPYKVAILYTEEYITKVSEKVAVWSGSQMLITHDKQEALLWLVS